MLFFVRVSWQFPARWSNCRQPFSLIMSLTPAPNCCFYYLAGWKRRNGTCHEPPATSHRGLNYTFWDVEVRARGRISQHRDPSPFHYKSYFHRNVPSQYVEYLLFVCISPANMDPSVPSKPGIKRQA